MASLLRFAYVMAAGRFHPRKSGSGRRPEAARFGSIRQDAAGRCQAFRERDAFVEQRLIEPFAPYLKEHSRYLETAAFFFQGRSNLELDQDTRPRGPIGYLTGLSDRVRVLEGRWPDGAAAPGRPLDVAVDRLGADLLQMGVSEVMTVFPATSFTDWPTAEVRIAAIFERVLGTYPSLYADITWHFFPDRRRMRARPFDVLRGGD